MEYPRQSILWHWRSISGRGLFSYNLRKNGKVNFQLMTHDTVFNMNISGINIAATELARSASTLFLDVSESENVPLYDPSRFHLTTRETNLLCNCCNLVGWTVVHNRDFFADILLIKFTIPFLLNISS